jgi:hypothetical protein
MVDPLIAVASFLAGSVLAWWLRGTIVATNVKALRVRIGDLERELGDERCEHEAVRREHERMAERLRSEAERRAGTEADLADALCRETTNLVNDRVDRPCAVGGARSS